MWDGLFSLLRAGLDFASQLAGKTSKPNPAADETVDAAKARAGTAAGAAANLASHKADDHASTAKHT